MAQTFKLNRSNGQYESELFRIYKYSSNTPHTTWKTSGYALSIKGHSLSRTKFSTLKEAKAWANTEDCAKWYEKETR